jgi:tetratricopeptide (TPR) repeat protein
MHCYMALIDASPKTADCRLGELRGCGARYCSMKCLVAAARAHKVVCEDVQSALQEFAKSRFRATKKTNRAALEWSGHAQIDLLRADMLVAASDVVSALLRAAENVRAAEAFELAQKLAQRALSLTAKGSLSEAAALSTLGTVSSDLSNFDAALVHYEAALDVRKRLLGDDHALVARLYISLSMVFQDLGRLDEALAMCSAALKIHSKAGDQNAIATCHQSMGSILSSQGKLADAMELFSTGLKITLTTDGETALAAKFLVNSGNILLKQNQGDKAMEKYVSALRIFEKTKVYTSIALCHSNIGTLLRTQGKFDEALEHARKSLEIRRSKLVHEHADCASSHCLIGDILSRSGRFAEAVDEFENALRIRKNVYGEMTLKVADVYEELALCNVGLQKWREAVMFYEATIHIRTVLGADDASLVKLKAGLADAEEELMVERSSAAAAAAAAAASERK